MREGWIEQKDGSFQRRFDADVLGVVRLGGNGDNVWQRFLVLTRTDHWIRAIGEKEQRRLTHAMQEVEAFYGLLQAIFQKG